MQTKLESFIERLIDTVLAFIIAWSVTYHLLPIYGANPSVEGSLKFVMIMTVMSFIRSYTVRRVFNYLSVRKYNKIILNKLKPEKRK